MKIKVDNMKILCLLMAVMMLASLAPAPVFAAVSVDNSYAPGTYSAEAKGYENKTVKVTVTLEKIDGSVVISDITADGSTQTPEYWFAAESVLDEIKKNNGTNGVDAVTNATLSSQAIIDAAERALVKAVQGFTSGSGTKSDPYIISGEAGLRYLQVQVANRNDFSGKYIKLNSDFKISGEWVPIGTLSTPFAGHFDGNNKTISNMEITDNILEYAGLFGYINDGATIKNVKLENVNININGAEQKVYAGSVVAFMKNNSSGTNVSVVDNCSASGTINVSTVNKLTIVGGIIGLSNQRAAITNCGADVDVTVDSGTGNATVGGLIAMTSVKGLFMNNYSLGDVEVSTQSTTFDNVGAMFGNINGIAYNCYTSGKITLNAENPNTPAGAFAGKLATAYADSCYYAESDNDAFGDKTGSANDKSVLSKISSEMKTEAFMQLLHENLAPAALEKAAENVAAAKISGCENFTTLTDRVNGNFQDWTVSGGKVVLSGLKWTTGIIDENIFDSGDGSEESPYLISNETQLRAFAASLNDKIDYAGKYIALKNDIKVSSEELWKPIGRSDYLFNGTFDGAGYTISGLTIGSEDKPYALDKDNIYIGLFGVLGPYSLVKDLNLTDINFHTTYEVSVCMGGIAGAAQGSTTSAMTGAVIDGCTVSGSFSNTADKGNQFIGGIIGMLYKGAVINSATSIKAACTVKSGELAEVGGIAGINNRGLVANCKSEGNDLYGSGNRDNGNEGMALVSNLLACNAGLLANCYASGDIKTGEHSTYAGMVTGWVTGIGKSYTCWYDLGSKMTLKVNDDEPQAVDPVESIGTKIASGVTEEGDYYTGGLVDKMTGHTADQYKNIAGKMNEVFAEFPVDISEYGLSASALKKWTYDDNGKLAFSDESTVTKYVQPECEKVVREEITLKDGVWYGRDADKTVVVKITVSEGKITETEVISGPSSGDAYDAAVERAEYKSKYGDTSHYEALDTSKFAGGKGTQNSPYLISNEAQLRYLAASINEDVDYSGVYFKQTADITLTDGEWQPIGWALNGEVNGSKATVAVYPFSGNYDGGDYSISGLKIGSETESADCMTTGLFGLAAGSYTNNDKPDGSEQTVHLKNINLKDIYINVNTRYETYAGGLVGNSQDGVYIDNCSVSGSIISETSESFSRAGGISASILRGAVTNSWSSVDVKAYTDTNHVYAASFIGMDNRATIINCYALGSVTGNSSNNNKVHIGGLTGQSGGLHINCYAAGDVVSLKTTTDVGILNGRAAGISAEYKCYYNTEALLKQGNTVTEPAKASGVVVSSGIQNAVEGKKAEELKNADFAALLSSNVSSTNLKNLLNTVNSDLEIIENESGHVHNNYYEGNELLSWIVGENAVTFGEFSSNSGGSGGSGGSSGGANSGNNAGINDGSQTTTPSTSTTVFSDVPAGSYYKSAVDWAVEKNITSGVTVNKFAPEDTCTRAQMVTFLWRAAGCPEPTSASVKFTDVDKNAYYYKAVLWAVENNIANGVTETLFAPDKTVTRGQAVTFQWRFAGGTAVNSQSAFTDVTSDMYCSDAVKWASENGITSGKTAIKFAPDDDCTRAQIVTFLYRQLGKTA